ncbi:MAG: hypothetical protein LBT18_01650 [Endomicrobium sp.]|nr:hypothetical protein [Endomicrobium sp.]
MNKILICFMFIFSYSFVCAIKLDEISSLDKCFLKAINEISVKVDMAKNNKEKTKLLETLAEMLIINKQYLPALSIYNNLLESKKIPKRKKKEYYVKLGDIYKLEKNYGFSLEYYHKALLLYKKNIDVRFKIGNMFLKNKLYNLAEKYFLEVLAINKNSDAAKKGLGDVYSCQNIDTKAIEYYSQINPKNYDKETVVSFVNCYRDLNRFDDAIKVLDIFMKENKDTELFFLSGLLFIDKKEYLKAKDMFLNSVQYGESNFRVYVYLALIYELTGEIQKAKTMYDKAYSINSSYAVVDLMQAKIAYKMNRFYEARRYAYNAYVKAKTVFVKNQAQKMIDFLRSDNNLLSIKDSVK